MFTRSLNTTDTRLGFNAVADATPKGRKFEPNDVVVYDKKGNHEGGRNVLQFSMEVRWLSEEDFKKRMGNEPYE